jgi:transposase InsO family protein
MRENGLRARQRRFRRTTDSHHAWPVAPNLLDQDFSAESPDQKWGSDISTIWTHEGWLSPAVVIDLFARRVVGWAVADRLHRELALAALRTALIMRRPAPGLIHHADRGSHPQKTVCIRRIPNMGRQLRRVERGCRGHLAGVVYRWVGGEHSAQRALD